MRSGCRGGRPDTADGLPDPLEGRFRKPNNFAKKVAINIYEYIFIARFARQKKGLTSPEKGCISEKGSIRESLFMHGRVNERKGDLMMNNKRDKKTWKTADGGYGHLVSCENTERLKHETAFHNPGGMDPNEILNLILDEYFDFVEKVRR